MKTSLKKVLSGTSSKKNSSSFFGPSNIQPKLTIGAPNDKYEREADAMADKIMTMPNNDFMAPMPIQRKCSSCAEEERVQTMPLVMRTGNGSMEATPLLSRQLTNSKGKGSQLPAQVNQHMSGAFSTDFSQVRVHTDSTSEQMNQGIQAKAFTHGSDVYFNKGQYNPDSSDGKRLLAHELTHVVQQDGGNKLVSKAAIDVQRLQMHDSCAGHEGEIREAEREGRRMTRETIETLNTMRDAMRMEGGPLRLMPTPTQFLLNTFGDIGGLEGGGGFTKIRSLIENYERIGQGFESRTARCDVDTVPENQCGWRSAFVVVGNRDDVFLCPNFFRADRGEGERDEEIAPMQRGQTLIHELAHSVLNATHRGLPENTFPEIFYDCRSSMELEYENARRNAFSYGILANCLHGTRPRGTAIVADENIQERTSGTYGGLGAVIGLGAGLIGGGLAGYFIGSHLAESMGGLAGGLIGAGAGIGIAGLSTLIGWGIGSLFNRGETAETEENDRLGE